MNFGKKPSPIPGCFEILPVVREDERGRFVKTFHEPDFKELGLETRFLEEFYSVSRKGVLRGLHFQRPPHDHVKLVYCAAGKVFDAVLDLRRDSPTYGKHAVFEVSAEKANSIYIPRGLAHGFFTLSENAAVVYKVSTVYSQEHDSGILWNSAGIHWPDNSPTISGRDAGFVRFGDFTTCFL
ncbi:MAG: dTDP-4-dehydrorhamnose 3,5-epimerase [Elusimicrobia bacterium GWB2_63_22]|nr:MAG: dTDP-4-dehydrorhamnose 3,5-epimerase [Elusimicrobia bacterium GWB2_63_22]